MRSAADSQSRLCVWAISGTPFVTLSVAAPVTRLAAAALIGCAPGCRLVGLMKARSRRMSHAPQSEYPAQYGAMPDP